VKVKVVKSMREVIEFEAENEADFIETMAEYGFEYTDRSPSGPRMLLRKELQNQPQFEGLHGPCYDCVDYRLGDAPGNFIHRYESWEVYNILSQ
jgi:hypothetical protein